MENMASIIQRHIRKIIALENKCLSTSLVYKACVSADENTEVKNYIGLTEGTFKQRFNGH